MNEFKSKKAKLIISKAIEALEELKSGCIKNTDVGICSSMGLAVGDLMWQNRREGFFTSGNTLSRVFHIIGINYKEYIVGWEHFSGSAYFPVPVEGYTPEDGYYAVDKWEGEQLEYRLNLCDYLLKPLREFLQKQEIIAAVIEELDRLGEGGKPYDTDYGICRHMVYFIRRFNLSDYFSGLNLVFELAGLDYYYCISGWKHFSGDISYPIPTPGCEFPDEGYYEVNKWKGDQLEYRKDFCKFLSSKLKGEI